MDLRKRWLAFALIAEVASPKRFAGLFSAAPSVALANLLVIAVATGPTEAQRQSTGMVVGAVEVDKHPRERAGVDGQADLFG